MGNFIIRNHSNSKMMLNESQTPKEQYILQGVFAQFDIENRNGRIYTKDEYLPHLAYLRQDLSNGESLLGELDHPEDRFEVSLQNASHQVLDLWLDESKNCVMGKIKLLDTPSGKIAKALIDDGVPLHISSRAAGSVDSRTKKVTIQQIFTFDLVCKPGFAAAVLHRVNESASSKKYSQDTMNFLNETIRCESANQASQFNIINENLNIRESFGTIKLRPEAQNIDINNKINISEMTNRLFEDEVAKPLKASDNAAAAMGIEQPAMTLETNSDDTDPIDSNHDNNDNNDNNGDKKSDDNLILGVRAESDNKEDFILNISAVFADDEDDSEEKSDDEKSDDENSDKETSNDENSNDEKSDENDSKSEIEPTDSNTLNDADKIEENKNKVISKVDELINNLKSKKAIKESQYLEYPFSEFMNETEYAKFDNLDYTQKDKVAQYIVEKCITGSDNINRLWENALVDETYDEPIWLKNASQEYRDLYENASDKERENLANCASYLIFESQYDVDVFWANSKLKEKAEAYKLNESLRSVMPIARPAETTLPYDSKFVDEITRQACNITEK